MSKIINRQYRIIRGYNNRYGLEALVRRIVRHHINSTEAADKIQNHPDYKSQER